MNSEPDHSVLTMNTRVLNTGAACEAARTSPESFQNWRKRHHEIAELGEMNLTKRLQCSGAEAAILRCVGALVSANFTLAFAASAAKSLVDGAFSYDGFGSRYAIVINEGEREFQYTIVTPDEISATLGENAPGSAVILIPIDDAIAHAAYLVTKTQIPGAVRCDGLNAAEAEQFLMFESGPASARRSDEYLSLLRNHLRSTDYWHEPLKAHNILGAG